MSEDYALQITIDGREVTLNVSDDCAIDDIDQDMHDIPGTLAWYGSILAAARERADIIDAQYRHWRATATLAVVDSGKFPEHVVKAKVEGDANFLKFKKAQAAADAFVVKLEKAWASLSAKADMLRSLGAKTRDEMRHTTVATHAPAEREMTRDEKAKAAADKIRSSRNSKREE